MFPEPRWQATWELGQPSSPPWRSQRAPLTRPMRHIGAGSTVYGPFVNGDSNIPRLCPTHLATAVHLQMLCRTVPLWQRWTSPPQIGTYKDHAHDNPNWMNWDPNVVEHHFRSRLVWPRLTPTVTIWPKVVFSSIRTSSPLPCLAPPLPLASFAVASRICRCGRPLDVLGHHRVFEGQGAGE